MLHSRRVFLEKSPAAALFIAALASGHRQQPANAAPSARPRQINLGKPVVKVTIKDLQDFNNSYRKLVAELEKIEEPYFVAVAQLTPYQRELAIERGRVYINEQESIDRRRFFEAMAGLILKDNLADKDLTMAYQVVHNGFERGLRKFIKHTAYNRMNNDKNRPVLFQMIDLEIEYCDLVSKLSSFAKGGARDASLGLYKTRIDLLKRAQDLFKYGFDENVLSLWSAAEYYAGPDVHLLAKLESLQDSRDNPAALRFFQGVVRGIRGRPGLWFP